MEGMREREARIETVLSLFDGARRITVEQKIEGSIVRRPRGEGEPIYRLFIPAGSKKTLAESREMREKFSPRKKAFEALCSQLFYRKERKEVKLVEIGEEVVVDVVLDRYRMKKVNRKLKVFMNPENGEIIRIPVSASSEE